MPVRERLNRKTERTAYCWNWSGSLNVQGYGVIRVAGKVHLVHRVAWELANGLIPDDLLVCHTCDNRRCVRLDHLWLGTAADNNADRAAKGRGIAQHGEDSNLSRLTEEQVLAIRARYAVGAKSVDLARDFGVTRQGVWLIVTRKAWRHVA